MMKTIKQSFFFLLRFFTFCLACITLCAFVGAASGYASDVPSNLHEITAAFRMILGVLSGVFVAPYLFAVRWAIDYAFRNVQGPAFVAIEEQ